MDVKVAEGLNKQPLDDITANIHFMGFNCVRFTWALFMFTDPSLGAITVRQSLRRLKLSDAEAGIERHNPDLLDLSVIETYKRVVSSLGASGLMVILDNHNSKPEWCCSSNDGSGFFGDKYFNPDVWVKGLTTVASTLNGTSQVVGMSLRNELRGHKQNKKDWYKYMQRGAEAVLKANPNVLVIVSGLNFDTNLNFLSFKPVSLSFKEKLIFELHWYAFTDGQAWANGNPNQVCGSVTTSVINRGGFLFTPNKTYTAPLFKSEFGIDQRGQNINDNRYISCFLAFAAENDLDWAYWALQGSYYTLSGTPGMDETYGPGLSDHSPYQIIYHPATGMCLQRSSLFGLDLRLGPCTDAEAWKCTTQKNIFLKGTYFCIEDDAMGKPARLGMLCIDENTQWNMVSDSKLHLSSSIDNGSRGCLDGISTSTVVTTACKCIERDSKCDPAVVQIHHHHQVLLQL
eukprot:Gb_20405 [translate_table: standard]